MLLLTPVLQLKSQNVCWRSEPWSRVKGELETCYRWLYVCSLTDTGAFKRNRQYQQSGALYTVTDVQSWESGICTSFSSSPLIFHTTVSCLVFIWVQNLDFFDFFLEHRLSESVPSLPYLQESLGVTIRNRYKHIYLQAHRTLTIRDHFTLQRHQTLEGVHFICLTHETLN